MYVYLSAYMFNISSFEFKEENKDFNKDIENVFLFDNDYFSYFSYICAWYYMVFFCKKWIFNIILLLYNWENNVSFVENDSKMQLHFEVYMIHGQILNQNWITELFHLVNYIMWKTVGPLRERAHIWAMELLYTSFKCDYFTHYSVPSLISCMS